MRDRAAGADARLSRPPVHTCVADAGCSSTAQQIQGLPTIVFVPVAKDKPALRTEGLLPAETIKKIVLEDLA